MSDDLISRKALMKLLHLHILTDVHRLQRIRKIQDTYLLTLSIILMLVQYLYLVLDVKTAVSKSLRTISEKLTQTELSSYRFRM